MKDRAGGTRLDKDIESCRRNPDGCAPLFRAWVEGIDAINMVPQKYANARIALAAGLVSDLMHYDHNKGTAFNALFPSGHWLQTPERTLIDRHGRGICGDYSTLIFETLLRTGFAAQDVSLIGGEKSLGGFHIVVAVKSTDGKAYIVDASPKETSDRGLSVITPTIVDDRHYFSGFHVNNSPLDDNPESFTPLFAMGTQGIKTAGSFLDALSVALPSGGSFETIKLPDMGADFAKECPDLLNKIHEAMIKIATQAASDRLPRPAGKLRSAASSALTKNF
ncbi:MAG: hypothetical protein KGI97_02365 [Alphaproteobacteria bacterium]|nr:hypothetical protein [Alphaproteobacteria bacterium]